MKRFLHLTCLMAALLSMRLCVGAEIVSQQLTVSKFKADLQQLKTNHFAKTLSAKEIESLKRNAAMACEPSDSWASILQLWVIGEVDFVELLWWRKDDTESRAFIVSLEWCMMSLPAKNSEAWPRAITDYESMGKRFGTDERALRGKETDFVRQNRKMLAKELAVILSASHLKMAEHYKAVAEKSQ